MTGLSRRRSRVRVPSLPLSNVLQWLFWPRRRRGRILRGRKQGVARAAAQLLLEPLDTTERPRLLLPVQARSTAGFLSSRANPAVSDASFLPRASLPHVRRANTPHRVRPSGRRSAARARGVATTRLPLRLRRAPRASAG